MIYFNFKYTKNKENNIIIALVHTLDYFDNPYILYIFYNSQLTQPWCVSYPTLQEEKAKDSLS